MAEFASEFLGKYRIVERLGGAGLGMVYKAEDLASRQMVALKVLRSFFLAEKSLLERFTREMGSVLRLRHPHILSVLKLEREENLLWIVMEYAPGGSLQKRLSKPLELEEALAILLPVAQALDYAHQRGLTHRNLKPNNILFDAPGQVLLSDFGQAILGENSPLLMKTGLTSPHPSYMSPEQAQGLPVDGRSDVYSLGVLLYHLLTLEVPFPGYTPLIVYAKQHSQRLTPPSAFNPALSPAVDNLVSRALARTPEGRFATPGQVAEQLEKIVAARKVVPALSAAAALQRGKAGQAPAVASAPVKAEAVPADSVYCPLCWEKNQAGRRFCAGCWSPLILAIPATAEAEARARRHHAALRRRRQLTQAAWVWLLVLVLALGGFYWVRESTPPPPATSNLTSASAATQWAMLGRDPSHTGFDPKDYPLLQGKVKWAFTTGAPIHTSPAVAQGVVYLAAGTPEVIALDAETGQVLWKYGTTGPVDSSPAWAGDLLYFGLRDGRLLALEARTGQLQWEYDTDNPIYSSPVVVDGLVYVGSGDRLVYALDALTGRLQWSFPTEGWIISSPVVAAGILGVGSLDGKAYFLEALTGKKRLYFGTDRGLGAAPAAWGTTFLISSDIGGLRALDMTEQERFLERPFHTVWAQLYIWDVAGPPPPQRGFLWAFRAKGLADAAPAVAEGQVYLGAGDGKVYALDAATGKKLWESPVKGRFASSPVVAGKTLYLVSREGQVYAFQRSTGEKLAEFSLGAKAAAAPALAGGVLYVTTLDGRLFAIE